MAVVCGTVVRAGVLVGVAVLAGFLHAQAVKGTSKEPMLRLPAHQSAGEVSPAVQSAAGGMSAQGPEHAPSETHGRGAVSAAPERTASLPPPPGPAPVPDVKPAAGEHAEWFITVQRAKELFDRRHHENVYFLDARTYDEFRQGHIPGAMYLNKKLFDGAVPRKVTDYLPGCAVVIYCHGEECDDSVAVAKRLIALRRSIGPIYIIREGFPGWKNAGYPVEVGDETGF